MGIESSEPVKPDSTITTAAPAVNLYDLGISLQKKLTEEYGKNPKVDKDKLAKIWGREILFKQVGNSVVFEPTRGDMSSIFYDGTGAHRYGMSGPPVNIADVATEVESRMRETLDICLGLKREGGTSGGASVPGNVQRMYHHGFSKFY